MILLLDVGNSRVKWGTLEDGALTHRGVTAHDKDNLRSLVGNDLGENPAPDRIIVANVAGKKFSDAFDQSTEAAWGIKAEYVVPARSAFGVINAYHEPERLGVDRWAAMIAARHAYKGALCVVDCGTALTLDVLAANGQHLGGLIIPGLAMMQSSLLEQTTGISINMESLPGDTSAVLPADTHDAVHTGALYASIATIDRVTEDMMDALGTEMTGVISGGAVPQLLPLLKKNFIHEPDLVLKGLAVIAGTAP